MKKHTTTKTKKFITINTSSHYMHHFTYTPLTSSNIHQQKTKHINYSKQKSQQKSSKAEKHKQQICYYSFMSTTSTVIGTVWHLILATSFCNFKCACLSKSNSASKHLSLVICIVSTSKHRSLWTGKYLSALTHNKTARNN